MYRQRFVALALDVRMRHTQVLLLTIQHSEKNLMVLKIRRVASLDQEITLHLDGRVTGPWVELLREYAEAVLVDGARLTLNLQNVCFIDGEGVGLIKSLMDREVQVNAPFFVAEQIRKCRVN